MIFIYVAYNLEKIIILQRKTQQILENIEHC